MERRIHAERDTAHLSMRSSAQPGQQLPSGLLSTKLAAPFEKSSRIVPGRAWAKLDQSTQYPLTLVCAPTGFGKTTALAGWANVSDLPVAWLSVDAGDNDPARFWLYVAAALDQSVPGLLDTIQPLVNRIRPLPAEPVVTALINALAAVPEPPILILDDYHTLRDNNTGIHEAMAYLLDHLPPQGHVVIAAQEEPPLPLARLRMRDSILELRTPDLALTLDETALFLNGRMRLGLSKDEVEALHARTEGWAAALHLAALSLRHRRDKAQAIAAFSGRDRHIFDILVDEVLLRLPEETQRFLLETSILERISASLADAVTQTSRGQATLEALARADLFLVPLDDERTWYRYHFLFAEALRLRLSQTQPELLPVLYRRAGAWCEAHEYPAKAIDCAFAAGDVTPAAELVEREAYSQLAAGRVLTVLRWIERLPEDIIRARPHLCVLHAYVLLLNSQFPAFASRLDVAVEALASQTSQLATEESALLHAEMQSLRATMAFLVGDLSECVALCRSVLDVLPERHPLREHALMNLGTSLWLDGAMEAAADALLEAKRMSEVDGSAYFYCSAVSILAQVRLLQGKIDEAIMLCRHAVRHLAQHGNAGNVAGIFEVWASASYERGELEAAAQHFERAAELGARAHNTPVHAYSQLMLAHVRRIQGAAPQRLSSQADQTQLWRWYADYIEAQRARLSVLQGKVASASAWVRARERRESQRRLEGSAYEPPQPLLVRVWEQVVEARVYLAEGNALAALQILAELAPAAEAGGRIAPLVEIQVLRVAALAALGALPLARETLRRTLALAQPYGFVRTFHDGGPVIRQLLAGLYAGEAEHTPPAGTLAGYALFLLSAFGDVESELAQPIPAEPTDEPLDATVVADADDPDDDPDLQTQVVDTLSTRELEVLHLLARGASNEDIAHELVIAIGTVKRHVSNIFIKLGTRSRTQAVARAHALRLIDLNRSGPFWKYRVGRRSAQMRPHQS